MPISTITAPGQITSPQAIYARLGLREGEKLEFSIDDAGRIVARPRHADKVYGILRDFAPGVPGTVDAMHEVVRRPHDLYV